jgi:hypothetical protein
MPKLPIPIVVELPSFRRAAKGLLDEEQTAEIVTAVALEPEAGVLLEGTGGVRKRHSVTNDGGKAVESGSSTTSTTSTCRPAS